uniref:Uncharacterized protein n=1 Tax=Parastrongyloides trichosuri TaxID=131310 RepID=A0A0N4ZCG6_PARTI
MIFFNKIIRLVILIIFLVKKGTGIERTPVQVTGYDPYAYFYSTVYNQYFKVEKQFDINHPRYKDVQGTLPPRYCGFNTYTRECMDPEKLCPGRCVNFQYVYNSRFDCRCLVI